MSWFHGVFCPCNGRKTRTTTSKSAQQHHSNSNHDLGKTTFFFIFLQNSTQLALGITATHHHSLVSSRQNASKKKQNMKKETKGPAVMMTHPIPPVPHYHSIHPFIPSHASHQHSRISFRPAVHRHHLMSTDETESFPPPKKASNIKHDSSSLSFDLQLFRKSGTKQWPRRVRRLH